MGALKYHISSRQSHWGMLVLESWQLFTKYSTMKFSQKAAFSTLIVLLGACGSEEGELVPIIEPVVVTANNFTTTIAENPTDGLSLGTVNAFASDSSQLIYSISSQSVADAILIEPSTGEISVGDTEAYDYEINTTITATYTASSGATSAEGSVEVMLTDVEEADIESGFVTVWRTTTANESIEIPVDTTLSYNYRVDWGDSNVSTNQTGNSTHTYDTPGVYTVTITGDFPAIFFKAFGFDPFVGIPEQLQIESIEQWGTIEWQTMNGAFFGCENLSYNASDTPDLTLVTDLSDMFNNAKSFNGAIGNWDVSNITTIEAMFSNADSFNQPLNEWDVSNVTNMAFLFFSADAFNQSLDQWDVSQVTTMESMFLGSAFNQPVADWDVSNVTNMAAMFAANDFFNQPLNDWDVSSLVSATGMFRDTEVFNQPLDQWNVSNVTDMREMFSNAKAFNQSLDEWNVGNVENMNRMFVQTPTFNRTLGSWKVSKVKDMTEMFNEATAFNQDLSGWDVDAVESCSRFGFDSGLAANNLPNFTNCTF